MKFGLVVLAEERRPAAASCLLGFFQLGSVMPKGSVMSKVQLVSVMPKVQLGSVMPKVLLQLCLTWFTFVQLGSTISITDLRVNYETHTAVLTFDCTQSYYFN